MSKILITGGSGFLGRRIVSALKEAGHLVFAPRSAEFNLESGQGVADYFSARKREGNPVDSVVHSAAYYGGLGFIMAEAFTATIRNLKMAAVVFEEAAAAGVRKIISVGSTCAYPGHLTGEMTEAQIFSGRCHESVDGYGFSKRAHLVLMAEAHKQFGVECNQIALSNLYGEGDVFSYRSHAAGALMRKIADAKLSGGRAVAWGTGKPLRQLLYVGDAAEVIARAVEFSHDDEPINAPGEEVSIRQLAEAIADAADFPRERIDWDNSKPDGVFQKSVSGEKLRALLPDFSPLPFADGIARTVHWYLQNKEEADRRK